VENSGKPTSTKKLSIFWSRRKNREEQQWDSDEEGEDDVQPPSQWVPPALDADQLADQDLAALSYLRVA
jgi:hypothetical protein